MNERNREAKRRYGRLYDEVASILFRHDPIGINFGWNSDEYELEAGTILPRLRVARSREDAQEIILQEFTRWFGESGPKDNYREIAADVWAAWEQFQLESGAG